MAFSINWTDIWPKLVLFLVLVGLSKLISFLKLLHKIAERKKQLPFPDIPYTVPDPHWLFGHLKIIGADDAVKNLHKICVEHAGPDGVSTFFHLNTPTLTLLDAKHAIKLLRLSFERIQLRVTSKHFKKLLGETSLIMTNGRIWKSGRNVVNPAFVPEAMDGIQHIILKNAGRFEETLKSIINRSENGTYAVDACYLTKLVCLDSFGLATLNHDFECTANGTLTGSQVADSLEYLSEEFNRRCYKESFNPAAQLYWIPVASNLRHQHEVAKLRNFLKGIIQKRQVELAEDDAPDLQSKKNRRKGSLLDHLIRGSLAELGEADEDYLSDFLITLIKGGIDNSSLSLAYTLYLLARHPEAQTKCVEEARRVLGEFPEIPDINSGTDLPYCNAVLNESLRMYPPVANLVRNLSKPMHVEIDGRQVEIPINTRVFISLYWIGRYEKNFTRANEFLPERWVSQQNDGTWAPRTFNPPHEKSKDDGDGVPAADINNLFTFSGGGRSCVGERFARRGGPAVLGFFLRSFKAELHDPNYVPKLTQSGPNQIPIGGIPMNIRLRD